MKTVEIICCLFIIVFALAVSHPLHENVFGDEATKQNDGTILAQDTVEAQVLPPSELDTDSQVNQEDNNGQKDSNFSSEDTKEQKRALSSYAYDQQDSQALTFSDEALETIFNDINQEPTLQTVQEA
ncbi:uncharacterized protein PHA67_022432 isoform 1-T1 [Liasis olivaceus]